MNSTDSEVFLRLLLQANAMMIDRYKGLNISFKMGESYGLYLNQLTAWLSGIYQFSEKSYNDFYKSYIVEKTGV